MHVDLLIFTFPPAAAYLVIVYGWLKIICELADFSCWFDVWICDGLVYSSSRNV